MCFRVLQKDKDPILSRNRDITKVMMAAESNDVEIPVWVGGIEKWVTGLTKRTTCDDLIYALLCHEGNPQGFLDVPSYAICEQCQGEERQLSGRTKIVKVWRMWGSDVRKIRFFMRKVDSMLPHTRGGGDHDVGRSQRSQPHHHIHHHRHHHKNGQQGRMRQDYNDTNQNGNCSSAECVRPHPQNRDHVTRRRSRSVEPKASNNKRNAFRSHKLPKEMESADNVQTDHDIQALEQLMSLLKEQERKLKDQQGRMKAVDVQIENYESKFHYMRMQRNGQNYVQEAYLRDRSDESSSSGGEEGCMGVKAREMEKYIGLCESLADVQVKLQTENSRIEDLSLQLLEQSFGDISLPPEGWRDQMIADPQVGQSQSAEEQLQVLQAEMHQSLQMGIEQQEQLLAVSESLKVFNLHLRQKADLMDALSAQLDEPEVHGDVFSPAHDDNSSLEDSGVSQTASGDGNEVFDQSADRHNNKHQTTNEVNSYINHSNKKNKMLPQTDGHDQSLQTTSTKYNMEDIVTDFHDSTRSRVESQTSDWDWENELPLVPQSLPAKKMIPYRTYTTYEDTSGLQLGPSMKQTALDDSNSDTGMSSLHSDEAPAILETLV